LIKEDLKQKIKDKSLQIKSDLKYQLSSIDWKQKLSAARAFFKKAGKGTWAYYKKLPQKTKRIFLSIAILTTIGVPVGREISKSMAEKAEIRKLEQEIKERTTDIKNALETKYKIEDEQSFRQLYEASLPLMQLSMFPTEVLVLDPYADNTKGVSNTIGLGSFYYPIDGDATSTDWELASKHFKKQGAHAISAEQALDLADGWYRHMDYGGVYKQMFKLLKGAELNAREFTAVATVMYNSKKSGKELCAFVQQNYQEPMQCAQKIVSFEASNKFGGIAKRHLHEAYLYLGLDDYVQKMYDFFVKTGVNSKGQFYAQTSVTQLSKEDVEAGKKAIASGDVAQIKKEQKKITSYICKGGQTVREIIQENVLDTVHKKSLMQFDVFYEDCVPLQDILDARNGTSADMLYKTAVKFYDEGLKFEQKGAKEKSQKNFEKALESFQKIIDGGHDGPDLHNDMAVTYYHLGEYQKCVDECAKVLKFGEKELFSAANFNAGKAYEALGNIDRAMLNYKAGIQNGGDEKVFTAQIQRLQKLQENMIQTNSQK